MAEIFEGLTTKLLISKVPKRKHGRLGPGDRSVFTPQLKTQIVTGVPTFRKYNVDMFKSELLVAVFVVPLTLIGKLPHPVIPSPIGIE